MSIYENPYETLTEFMIHPGTKSGKNVRIGEGVIIEEGCKIGDNCIIGHHVVLRPNVNIGDNTVIGHGTVFEGDCSIGNNVLIHAQCHITKGVLIEDDVFIAPFLLLTNTRNISHGRKNVKLVLDPPVIRRAARIAGRVSILPGVEIGENAVVGLGSVVTKNVPAGEIWFGTPARKKGIVPKEEWL